MKCFPILFLLVCSGFLFGQEVNPGFNVVVAPSGLKLRDAPSLKSKVIKVIPYHGKVVYLDQSPHGVDTVGQLSDFPRMSYQESNYAKAYKDRPIVGSWVHVRYQEKEGYAYNPYLGPEASGTQKRGFFLISPGENCGDQFYALDQFYTYGVYSNGRKTWTEVVEASYVVQTEGVGFLAPILTTNRNKDLHYVIGSRKAMSMPLQKWSMFSPYSLVEINETEAGLPNVVVSDSVFSKKEILKMAFFFDQKTGRKQKIDNASYGNDYKIIGQGDLDGDGRTDILLEFRNEGLIRRLYLSTLAAEGDIYGLAAEESFGPCC